MNKFIELGECILPDIEANTAEAQRMLSDKTNTELVEIIIKLLDLLMSYNHDFNAKAAE